MLKYICFLFIVLCKSCGIGSPEELRFFQNNEKSEQSGLYENIPSCDVLASDWLDLEGWNFAKDKETYKKIYQESA